MDITLLVPPLTDPTTPYHAPAYLLGHLRHAGFSGAIRDLNIEFIDWCLRDEGGEVVAEEAQRRLSALLGLQHLDFQQQEALHALNTAAPAEPAALASAVAVLRHGQAFLDYDSYRRAVETVTRHLRFVGALCYPGEIANGRLTSRGRFSIYNLDDLFDERLASRACRPVELFFDACLRQDTRLAQSSMFGFSVTYDHQWLPAVHLARLLRRTWPDKPILLGGTAVTQFVKNLKDRRDVRRFFSVCDALVAGEGETALCEILDAGPGLAWRRPPRNTIVLERDSGRLHLPETVHYENVAALARPVYEYPWELYLSPARGVGYSATRGCYWNHCVFCDYGLNSDTPTSPWRERPVDQVVADLRAAADEHGVRHVYFAVDAMAPAYLGRLADAILASGLDLRWWLEARLEKAFTAQLCRKLARAGCVAVSVGMESGAQRVLNLMRKGTRLEDMARVMRDFAEAGIAVQIMAFSHFPTETAEERAQTLAFAREHRTHWSAGGVGRFMLTGASRVAREPAAFGIRPVTFKNASSSHLLAYQEAADGVNGGGFVHAGFDSDREGDGSPGGENPFPSTVGRPWAGGTDTFHSILYYQAHGRDFFKTHPLSNQPAAAPPAERLPECFVRVQGRLVESLFDLVPILRNRKLFAAHIESLWRNAAEPTHAEFLKWCARAEGLSRTDGPNAPERWVVSAARCVKVGPALFAALTCASDGGPRRVREILPAEEGAAQRVLTGLTTLAAAGLVVFASEAGAAAAGAGIGHS